MTAEQAALRQAIDWHLRLGSADAGAWRAFTAWLEADIGHAVAYDAVALDDSLLMGALTTDAAAGEPIYREPPRSRRPLAMTALAAGMALALAGAVTIFTGTPHEAASSRYAVETDGQAVRSIVLEDGSRIDLNRNTRLLLDRKDRRFAMLDRGEAVFRIHHDARAPFRVETGGMTLQDTGTTFNVIREPDRMDVSVAEGGVLFEPARDAISLKPGMVLSVRGRSPAVVKHVAVASVGGWQRDRIDFHDAVLADVAADASRLTGARIAVAPAIARQRFSGSLRSDRGAAELVASMAALTGNKADRRADGWMLTADGGGAR